MRPTPANTHHAWGGKYLVWFGHSDQRYFFEALSTHGARTLYSVKCEIAAHELTCQEVIRTSYGTHLPKPQTPPDKLFLEGKET